MAQELHSYPRKVITHSENIFLNPDGHHPFTSPLSTAWT